MMNARAVKPVIDRDLVADDGSEALKQGETWPKIMRIAGLGRLQGSPSATRELS